LIAVYWRKADRHLFEEEALAALIDELAARLPVYRLPTAVHTHTRHYMPTRAGSSEKTTLVFDAFARTDKTDELIIGWPGTDLSPQSSNLLAHLAASLGYLGRAEAWVEAEISERAENAMPWKPHVSGEATADGEQLTPLLAPLSVNEWKVERARHLDMLPAGRNRNRTQKAAVLALPERLADAIALDTADWQSGGWSAPPSSKPVLYRAPVLAPVAKTRRTSSVTRKPLPTIGRFVLAGNPRPRVEDTIVIGELMRLATLSKFEHDEKGRRRAPRIISGRDIDGAPSADATHGHAFFLPEDADDDGLIDHVVVFVRNGMDDNVQHALDRVTRLWQGRRHFDGEEETASGREEWRLALEGFGKPEDFEESCLLGRGTCWQTITPYLTPWHRKKNLGVAEQIRREIVKRELMSAEDASALSITPVDEIGVKGRKLRPINFYRFRSRRGLTQPDKLGTFISLRAEKPIGGPLALGFACHFGLGLFRMVKLDR
jgi:CRISPR-associated protein Csb2